MRMEMGTEQTLGGHGLFHEHMLWVAALLAFVVAAIGLWMLYRSVSRRVELERAEAILEAELGECEPAKLDE